MPIAPAQNSNPTLSNKSAPLQIKTSSKDILKWERSASGVGAEC